MNLRDAFPVMWVLNLAKRQDRRARCEEVFEAFGLPVSRFPAVNAKFVRRSRGFESAGRYAHAVSTRMILRRAKLARAEAVFIFEDDVLLSGDLHERLAEIELPDDWGMFYLGCQHHERPEVVAPGLVRVAGALDTHAWGVRADFFDLVMRSLAGRESRVGGALPPADVLLARLHEVVPTYAAFPNLAWQAEEHTDLVGGVYSNYAEDGTQRTAKEVCSGIAAQAVGARAWDGHVGRALPPPFYARRFADFHIRWGDRHEVSTDVALPGPELPPLSPAGRVAFLFLTRGEHRHPAIWQKYFEAAGDGAAVCAHTKDRGLLLDGSWLGRSQIAEQIATRWGDVSLVRAQLALLRAALEDGHNEFFVFLSESCVPVRPFTDLRRLLALDGRSRFGWRALDDLEEKADADHRGRALGNSRVPASYWRFHPQWVMLNREAASLVLQDDLTAQFDGVTAADECYFGTVLELKGYPLEERVAARDMTWTDWAKGGEHPVEFCRVTPTLAADLVASGCFFARKFSADAQVRDFGLHLGNRFMGNSGAESGRPFD